MSARIAQHLRNNVYGLLALFIALSGSAYAAGVAKNTVNSESIVDREVRNADLASGAITSSKLAKKAVTSKIIKNGQIKTADLASGAITRSKFASGAAGFTSLVTRTGATFVTEGVVAMCEAGELAVGGGGETYSEADGPRYLSQSYPVSSMSGTPANASNAATGWLVDGGNNGLVGVSALAAGVGSAYVICAS